MAEIMNNLIKTESVLRKIIGRKANFSLYKDISAPDRIYVRHPLDRKSEICTEIKELNSKEFRNWIFYFNGGSKPLKDISDIQENAVAVSGFDESIEPIEIAKRVAYCNKNIYLCLHDKERNAVEITPNDWNIIKEYEAPVLFLHSSNLKALPIPEQGGNLKDLQKFINVDDKNLSLTIGWILATFNSKIDCPILHIEAPKGTGKTTATKFLKELIDPDTTGVVAPFRSYRDLCAASKNIHLFALDNLSGFSKKESDELCRAVTGAGHLDRKLYTDNTLHTTNLHNPFITNGISFGELQADLRDRCYSIKLNPLDGMSRQSKEDLNNEFEAEKSKLLGAILDSLVYALRNEDYEPEIDTRMIDAGKFIMRAAHDNPLLPFTEDEFKSILIESKKQEEINSALDNPIACAIYNMTEDMKENCEATDDDMIVWDDTTRKLLIEVISKAKNLGIGKDIPKSPVSFGKKLKEVRKILKLYNIEIGKPEHTDRGSKIKIIYRNPEEVVERKVEELKEETVENDYIGENHQKPTEENSLEIQ